MTLRRAKRRRGSGGRLSLAALLLGLGLSLTSLQAAALRVISLSPHTTELAYAAGLGDSLVAASAYSDYPPQAATLEKVASWNGINLERILALKPDLILAWHGGNPRRVLDQLSALGITLFYSDPQRVSQVADDLDRLAAYSPHPEQAHRAAAQFRQRLQQLRQRYAQGAPLRVMMQFGNQPLFSTSAKTLQSDLLALCGAQNIFADSPVPWPQVSREQVIVRRPQAIVIGGDAAQAAIVTDYWRPQLRVPVIAVNQDWLNRSGPRILLAAESLCAQLHTLSTAATPR
ncbi:vitamin B12 ABC transporter substrate-binding protein BtuF [Edwardsiella piscicida]|uniref:vitamin B12 ABC transporter substrate-binding protein BtuF n=1 Tax=Edwardsiella piscicida TaxID=1263550 RepID=UPI0010A60927